MNGLVLCLDAANPRCALTAVEVLVVAGGGAGGGGIGGGGGGGGVVYMPSVAIAPGTGYSIVVGAGGTPVVYSGISGSGGASTAFGATAAGGGGSGVHDSGDGVAGGSGGGAASNNGRLNQGGASSGNSLGPNSGFIYGSRGGNMLVARTGSPTAAAGGGGAGAAAADTNSNTVQTSPGAANGRGGAGILNSILGPAYYWGGGGGGGAYFNGYAGDGGIGGGGGGSCSSGSGPTSGGGSALNSGTGAAINTNGGAGGANTGGGGGGGAWQVTSGGAGGSGIVIVKYAGPQRATGGTITSVNGSTIHTFTTSGTFTPNVLLDLSGLGNTGTLINAPTYNSANGGSIVFDGVDDYIDCGNPASLNSIGGTNNVTVSAWVYHTAYGGGGQPYSVITVKGNPWTWLMENPSNTFRFRITAGGADVSVADTATHLLNRWYNVVGTYDGANMRIYVDGILKNTRAQTGTLATNSVTAKIGTYQGTNYNLTGRVANIQVYNRTLTATEVQQNFSALRGRYGV
jgi:hypothetical protein